MPTSSKEDPDRAITDARQLQEFVRELTAGQGRIRAFIISLMPGSPDIGDVLQETNLTMWKSRDRFQPGSNFMAWALTIARLEVLHHRTRAKRQKVILISDDLLEILAEEVPESGDHEAYLTALDSCKSKLTEEQRSLIDRRYQPGHSLAEQARETGQKAPALRVALMRIRIALRECIERELNPNRV